MNTYCKYCWQIYPKNEKHECIGSLRAERDALQARIDSLMLEYCPEEMNHEQMTNWAKHQKSYKLEK